MNIKLQALDIRHVFGRSIAVCTPYDADTGKAVGPEQGLAEALSLIAAGHTIVNAQEVLECVVKRFGFGA